MLTFTSMAFADYHEIPKKYTCEGEGISPPLAWSDVPTTAKSLALIVLDPDAPDPKAPTRTNVHWLLYNIPPQTQGLAEAASSKALPSGSIEGFSEGGKPGFKGPCPHAGRHRYFFTLYALDRVLETAPPMDRAALDAAIKGHVLEQIELVGTYQKVDA